MPPHDFGTNDGRNGDAILDELLPFPTVECLFYGAIRQAIADAHFYAVTGGWYGDLIFWGDFCYVDNQQGEYAVIQFCENGCLGVVSSGDPWREYDSNAGLAIAPLLVRSPIKQIIAELKRWCSASPTGLFWSNKGQLEGPEPFRVLYKYGLETMENLRLSNEEWIPRFIEGFQSKSQIAEAIVSVATRYCSSDRPVEMAPEHLAVIFPNASPARDKAMELVTKPGLAEIITPMDDK